MPKPSCLSSNLVLLYYSAFSHLNLRSTSFTCICIYYLSESYCITLTAITFASVSNRFHTQQLQQNFSQPISPFLTYSSSLHYPQAPTTHSISTFHPSFLQQPLLHIYRFPIPQQSCHKATPQSPKGPPRSRQTTPSQNRQRTLLPDLRPGPSG